jgi:predicted dehydrogenase
MTFGVLIIGLGQIGMGYDLNLDPDKYIYSHSQAFNWHPDFHLIAGVDPDPKKRQDFELKYKCFTYADIETALDQSKPELVVIATPTLQHKETLVRVLSRSQPKVVLCEKPLSYDLEEGRFMVNACSKRGISLYVNYMRRSDPGVIEVKRRLELGDIKNPIKGVAWYTKGFIHNGSHFFNMLEYWLGPMQDAVVIKEGRLWNQIDPEPDVHVKFEYGEVVFLAAWEELYSNYALELISQNGRLSYEQGGELIKWQSLERDLILNDYRILSKKPEEIETGIMKYQWHVVDQLARSLNQKNYVLCSGTEALNTLITIKNILSMNSN